MGPVPFGGGCPVSAFAEKFEIKGYPPVRFADRGSTTGALALDAKKGNHDPHHALAGNDGTFFFRASRPLLETKRAFRKVFV